MPPTPNARPQRISIRPHCTIKTQSSICQEDEDIHNDLEKEETRAAPFPMTEEQPESSAEAKEATEGPEQAEQNFYMHEFEDFISVSSATVSTTSPARRDSLTIAAEALPANVDVPEPNPRGRSRHSPPATAPVFPFPSIPTLPPVQTCARKDSRPFPRVAVPLDIEDCIFPEESEIPETPLSGTDSEVVLPGSSTDSDPPCSSVDSTLSFASSGSSDTPTSPLSFPKSPSPDSELESTQRLRSRWSTSSLDSPAVEPPRTPTLLFPLRNVFGSRARRGLLPPQNVPPQMSPHLSKNMHGFPTKHSRLGTLSKRIRRQGLRSSTSSAGTSSSECDSHEGSPRGSPRGLKRKLTPVSMFLRTT
ncbi:hypothetical protein J3R82DRAFT_6404 [Butyriboletus roseoflavus]|nr:hypothetical protein J3R82DRAFT_6404 [Butyriboletus roseoflavus]